MDTPLADSRKADAVVAALALAALGWGWHTRADPMFDVHGWPSWWLGLIGAVMMAATGGYAWIKRTRRGQRRVG